MSVSRYFGLGPDYEEDFIDLLKKRGMDPRTGAHAYQLKKAAKGLGLKCQVLRPGTIGRLRECLSAGRPVLMMIQAWGEDEDTGCPLESYSKVWKEGYWVVAIGFDDEGVFFEDPSLEAVRGFIEFEELKERWRDLGPHGKHISNYGLVMWKPGVSRGGVYQRRARIID